MIGTRMEVTITEAATSAVAVSAAGRNSGFRLATSIGFATAAPAVLDAARPAVPLPPPIYLSARISGIPVITITVRPSRIPSRPVSRMTPRSIELPSAKPKNGMRVCVAFPK
ncbi:hypothetical protein D3C80_1741480 [compost metagenome]